MIVLGVDPPNACSVVDLDTLLHADHCSKGVSDYRLCKFIEKSVDIALQRGAKVMALEGQFGEWRKNVPENIRRAKVRSALVLARRAGMWVQEWHRQSEGKRVEIVDPAWWYAKAVGAAFGNAREDRKAGAKVMCAGIYGATLQEDEADATGIARAVSVEMKAGGMI